MSNFDQRNQQVNQQVNINQVGDTTTSAEHRAQAAYGQIMEEVLSNFSALTVTLWDLMEREKPVAFWDIRRANETELAYQDRARHFFQEYLTHLHMALGLNELSTTVYDSFKRDLAHNERRATHIKDIYGSFKSARETFHGFEQRLRQLFAHQLTDQERVGQSEAAYKEMLVNAKIALTTAVAKTCLVADAPVHIAILIDTLKIAHIDLPLQFGRSGFQVAQQAVAGLYTEKAALFQAASTVAAQTTQREIERRINDPYLNFLRRMTGLPTALTASDVLALQRKETNETEHAPAALLQLAALSFLEADGHTAAIYLQRALAATTLTPFQQKFIELSLHRLQNPQLYKDSLGFMIFKVAAQGNFERAGVKAGDVLISINGQTLVEPLDIASELAKNEQILIGLLRGETFCQVVATGGESAGVTLSPLIIANALQL